MEPSADGSVRRRRLVAVRRRLEGWRRRHGGRGTRIPEGIWDEAAAVARTEGVEETARALRLDPGRLARRVSEQPARRVAGDRQGPFVELQAVEVGAVRRSIIELAGPDGEQMRIEIPGELDVPALVRAFWERGS